MKSILIVDDDIDLRTVVKMRLEIEGYNVNTASNGKECLGIVAERKPDLILLDMTMPVMDGYTALNKLKEQPESADIPVIIFSIKEKIKMEGLFMDDKAAYYIEKPFETEELIGKVKAVLGE
ncbi:MAG: response regulator [Candidatus Kaelpia aquatica]|nr:response regulator [Candidatus Kaelpia aquatica]